jgi:hypothetical protein
MLLKLLMQLMLEEMLKLMDKYMYLLNPSLVLLSELEVSINLILNVLGY